MDQIRVVVNALGAKSGAGPVYLSSLFPALAYAAPEYHFILLVGREEANGLQEMPGNVEVLDDAFRSRSGTMRVLWEQFRLRGLLDRLQANVLFSAWNTAPLGLRVPSVVVVHVNYAEVRRHTRGLGARLRWDLLYWISGLAARRAVRVIAVSEMVRDFLVARRGVKAERVRVVHHPSADYFRPIDAGSARRTVAERFGVNRPYVLMVADIYRHKNIERLLEAFAGMCREPGDGYDLVLVGRPVDGVYLEEVKRKTAELGLAERFHYVGPVAHRELPVVFNGATMSILPSLTETFGIPLVESMACGTPVAASRIAAFEEVVDDAGVLFDPCDVGEITSVLRRLLGDQGLRDELRRKGFERVRMFSQERFVSVTLGVIQEALSETTGKRGQ